MGARKEVEKREKKQEKRAGRSCFDLKTKLKGKDQQGTLKSCQFSWPSGLAVGHWLSEKHCCNCSKPLRGQRKEC